LTRAHEPFIRVNPPIVPGGAEVAAVDLDLVAWVAGLAILAGAVAYALRHLKEMPGLAAYIELVRPFTLLAPMIAGASFGLMGEASRGWADWNANPQFVITQLISGVGALVLVNAASNALNAVYDLDIDRINKPNRPLPRGAINPHEATTIAWLLYLITLFRATFINPWFGGFVLIIMFLTVAYNAPPFRLKKRFIINNVTIALARGLFGVVASWSIFGDPLSSIPWTIGFIFFVFLVGAATTKDFTDIPGDSAYGVRTLPVVIGVNRAATVTAAFFVIPIGFIAVAVYFQLLYPNAWFLILLGIWGAIVFKNTKEWAEARGDSLENNPLWVHMYALMMALALGFAVTFVIV
jgi:chlorophyll/bacteriochlorophyll a synthase